MSLFDGLDAKDSATLDSYLEERRFRAGDRLVRQGDVSDGCFILQEGTVRLEIAVDSLDGDGVLGFLDAGDVLGELSFFDDAPRSATAVAETAVVARWLSLDAYRRLGEDAPAVALRLLSAVGAQLSGRLRTMNQRVATQIASDNVPAFLDAAVERARVAGEHLRSWSDTRIEGLIASICRAVAAEAETLATQSVTSVGIGVATDQASLLRSLAERLPEELAELPSAGTLVRDAEGKLVSGAYPVGVIAGLIPANAPVATMLYLAAVSLRARAPLVCAAHRRATAVVQACTARMRAALADNGAPSDLLQCLEERPSRRTTLQLVGHSAVGFVVAAAGPDMARAALQSGKPAFAQGTGDTPVLVCSDADVASAASAIVESRSFDAGLLAAGEGMVHVVRSAWEAFVAALERSGCAVLNAAETEMFVATFGRAEGGFRGSAIGQPAGLLAQQAGIRRDGPIRCLAIPVARAAVPPVMLADRAFPALALQMVDDDADGIALVSRWLRERRGALAAALHTTSDQLVERFAAGCEVPRVVVNQGAALAAHGVVGGEPMSMVLPGGTAQGCAWSVSLGPSELRNVRKLLRAAP